MATQTPKLEWCIVRLGQDMNWWVEETSDPIHWDTIDGLSIMDPRQMTYLIDSISQFDEYGLQLSLVNRAFYKFKIEGKQEDGRVRLVRVKDSLLSASDDEPLFALPDVMDEEKGPYADLFNQVTRARVKMLNDLIDFEEHLTIEELEEEIRDQQAQDYMEGKSVHLFAELCSILEFVPAGYELDLGDEDESSNKEEYEEEFPDVEEETIERDETMKWGDEDEEDSEEDEEEKKLFKLKVSVKEEKKKSSKGSKATVETSKEKAVTKKAPSKKTAVAKKKAAPAKKTPAKAKSVAKKKKK